MEEFGRRLRTLRMELGYTQTQIAEFLGTTLRTVQRWEAGGGTPHLSQLILEKMRSLPKAQEPRAGRPGRRPRSGESRKKRC